MTCLILAAGYATRLHPLTENFPKPLLDVQGRTVLDWLLSDVDRIEGIGKYVVVSNHKFFDHFTTWKESCSLSHPVIILDDGSTCECQGVFSLIGIDVTLMEKCVCRVWGNCQMILFRIINYTF